MSFPVRSALLGLALGLPTGLACSTNTQVELETYAEEAAEDYGCIVGDLHCECLPGNLCDGGLTCVDGQCKCVEGACKEEPPVTTSESDSGTSGETATDSSGTDSGTTDPTTDTGTTDPTTESTTESTSDSSTTDPTTDSTSSDTTTTDGSTT